MKILLLLISIVHAEYIYKDNEVLVKHSQTVLGTPYSFSSPFEPNPDCVQEIKNYDSESYKLNPELEKKLIDFEERVKNCHDNSALASKYKDSYSKMYAHFKGQDKVFENYITNFLPVKMNMQVSSHIGHHWNNMIGSSKTLHTFRVNGQALNDIPLHKVEKKIGRKVIRVLPCDFQMSELKSIQGDLERLSPFINRYWEYGSCNKYLFETVSNKTMPNGMFVLMGSDGTKVNLSYDNLQEVKSDRPEVVKSGHYNPPKLPTLFISRQHLDQFNEKNAKVPKEEKTIWQIVSETYFKFFYPQLIETEIPD